MFQRLVIIALVVSAGLVCSVRGAANEWTRLETVNFEFVGDAPESSIRTAADRLERFREALAGILQLPARTYKTRVIVFKDSATFRAFKPSRADGTPDEKVVGLFVAGDDVNTIALAADNLDLGTIFHEYVHEIVTSNFGSARVPPWLNEGLASYFQTFQIADGKTASFGSPRPEYQTLLRSGPLMPWEEFFALDNFTLHRDAVKTRPIFYAQAWALAAYLIAQNRTAKRTVNPASLIAALDKLDRSKLGEYLNFAGTDAAVHRIELGSASPRSLAATSTLSEASADAILGELLYRQRNQAAEAFLTKAIELDPKLAAAYSTLGQLRLRDRKFAEAKSFLEKAIALDSRNHLSHFYYAFLLLRENLNESSMLQPLKGDVLSKIREALSRSVALNDEFAESHYLLATVEYSSGEISVAETEARRAVDLTPGNPNYSLLLARVLLRRERIEDAVAIAEPLATRSGDSRIAADSREILKNADELARAKRTSIDEPPLQFAGYRKPVILQYRDLTPERVSKIDRDRENYNYNVMIDRPAADESHLVGYVDRVDCIDEKIEFKVRSQSVRLTLSTRKFDDVRFRVAVPGTRSFAFRCGTRFPNDLAVIVYKSGRAASTGELRAITFVAPDFEFMTTDELRNAPMYVVEGRPGGDISQNAEIAAKEREAMEREMRETQLRDIRDRLRQLLTGEDRVIGVPEKLECKSGRMNVSFKVDNADRVFSSAITTPFDIQSFTSEAPIIETGCLAQLPNLPAVITFRKADGELISVEFVPAFFKLN